MSGKRAAYKLASLCSDFYIGDAEGFRDWHIRDPGCQQPRGASCLPTTKMHPTKAGETHWGVGSDQRERRPHFAEGDLVLVVCVRGNGDGYPQQNPFGRAAITQAMEYTHYRQDKPLRDRLQSHPPTSLFV